MPTILDSYSEANADLNSTMDASGGVGHNLSIGQAFCAVKAQLDSAVFSLKKTGSPTGNAVVKLYAEAHTTAFGTNSVPSGAALATSDPIDVSTLTTSLQLITFTFTGANRVMLNDGYYIIAVEYTGGDASNNVNIGVDSSAPTHLGNAVFETSANTWSAFPSDDAAFYVYGILSSTPGNVGRYVSVGNGMSRSEGAT